jgi:hypothetical protein
VIILIGSSALGSCLVGCSSSGGLALEGEGGSSDAAAASPEATVGVGSEGGDAGAATKQDAAPDAAEGEAASAGPPTVAMPHISFGAPAFASSSASYQTVPADADDDNPLTAWTPSSMPAWIALDVSGAPSSQRDTALFVWNAMHAASYLNTSPPSGADMPTDYVVEVNTAPGGAAAPPGNGWTTVATVSGNLFGSVESPIALAGANWVRMSITGATDATLAIDVDLFSTPHGATDCWMFMGDSVTYITMPYPWNDVPSLVHAARPDRWPAVINAAVGGTNTSTAAAVIDATMSGFPGRYVALPYGTNDNVSQGGTFEMETLVQHVLAAGKVPVVPHMPWADVPLIQTNGPIVNGMIDALYAKYPQILRGPDLWAAFLNRTDLIPSGDVHPNAAGQEVLRQQWAAVMAAVP